MVLLTHKQFTANFKHPYINKLKLLIAFVEPLTIKSCMSSSTFYSFIFHLQAAAVFEWERG